MGSPGHTVSVGKMTNQWMYDKTLNGNVHSIYTPQFCCQVYSGTATNMNGFTIAYFRVPSDRTCDASKWFLHQIYSSITVTVTSNQWFTLERSLHETLCNKPNKSALVQSFTECNP